MDHNQLRIESQGVVQIEYEAGKGDFAFAIIRLIPNYGVLVTLDWNQTQAFIKVCELVFENIEMYQEQGVPNYIWADTGFHFMAPLYDKPEVFWFCYGPLSCYVPKGKVLTAYKDLQKALELLGGKDRFSQDTHN
jgi:hypothetical protein